MSSYQLAKRMDFSPTRVRQLEGQEVDGSIRLSVLRRAAEAMNCSFFYVFVPNVPLEQMVLRQARHKAAERLSISDPDGLYEEEENRAVVWLIEDLEDLTLHFVDHRDLWQQPENPPAGD
jgi:predicted DNA-binding mobile mystery protein A